MSCEDIPSLLDLQNIKKHADDFGRLMGTGTGTSTNGVTGQVRPTYNAVTATLGYTRVGTFATGGTLTTGRQTLLWDIADGGDGQEYGWSGSFPLTGKVVPPNSTPLTTGGIAVGAWMSRFDPELRTEIYENFQKRVTTVAEVAAGEFEVGDVVELSDRGFAKFNISAGGTPNGFDILDSGNGNTAILQVSGWLNALSCGFSPSQSASFNVGAFNRVMAISRFVYVLKSSGEYLVDSTINNNIRVPSNTFLFFEQGTTLRSTDNAATDYRVIWINNVENVTICNGIFRGDKDTHLGVTGEGGHAVGCYSSNNVKLYDCQGHDSWGVGLAIVNCNDFYAENVWCDNGRQNSAAIISGTNVKLLNPTFSNASGTAPSAGLDIEPNTATDRLENIQIINPRTYGNAGAGIQISLGFWAGGSNVTDITITNHVDRGSLNAFWVSQLQDGGTGGNDGVINYIKGVAFDTKETSILVSNYSALRSPRILIDTPTVYRPNAVGGALVTQFAGIALERASAFTNTNKLGNIYIKNPTVIDNRATKKMVQAISVSDFKGIGYQDTVIEDPVKLDGVTSGLVSDLVRIYSGVAFSDKLNACGRNFTTSPTAFGGTSALGEITNRGAVSLIGFALPASQALETNNTVKFTNFETTGLRIMPGAAAKILPISQVAGKYIQTTELGASIVLVRRGVNDWYVKEIVGTWSVQP